MSIISHHIRTKILPNQFSQSDIADCQTISVYFPDVDNGLWLPTGHVDLLDLQEQGAIRIIINYTEKSKYMYKSFAIDGTLEREVLKLAYRSQPEPELTPDGLQLDVQLTRIAIALNKRHHNLPSAILVYWLFRQHVQQTNLHNMTRGEFSELIASATGWTSARINQIIITGLNVGLWRFDSKIKQLWLVSYERVALRIVDMARENAPQIIDQGDRPGSCFRYLHLDSLFADFEASVFAAWCEQRNEKRIDDQQPLSYQLLGKLWIRSTDTIKRWCQRTGIFIKPNYRIKRGKARQIANTYIPQNGTTRKPNKTITKRIRKACNDYLDTDNGRPANYARRGFNRSIKRYFDGDYTKAYKDAERALRKPERPPEPAYCIIRHGHGKVAKWLQV